MTAATNNSDRGDPKEAGPRRAGRGLLPSLIGYHLRRAQIAVFQDFTETMSGFEMTPGRFGVLEVIAANPGLSQSELGAILAIDRSTVVAVIDRLEEAGLVHRRAAPNDRRSHALSLSEHGGVALGELRQRVLAHEERISRALSPEERQQLIALLRRVAAEP